MKFIHQISTFISIFVIACTSTKETERTFDSPYKKNAKEIKADLYVFHESDSLTNIYYRLSRKSFTYRKSDTCAHQYTEFTLKYFLYNAPNGKQLLDSGTQFHTDRLPEVPEEWINGDLVINCPPGKITYLDIYIRDRYGKSEKSFHVKCNKSGPVSFQNFLIKNDSGFIHYERYFKPDQHILVKNYRYPFTSLRVDYFRNNFSLPPPPFSSNDPELLPGIPDSSFVIFTEMHGYVNLHIPKSGVYFFRPDTFKTKGFSMLSVEKQFPEITTHDQMIACTRYIMSRNEFNALTNATDKQAAIDAFWIKIAGNKDRARELIRRFYNRVRDANLLFSTLTEGWKTDMGMIYIIFGSPGKVYKSAGMETWVYGQEGTPNSVTFQFDKVENSYSEKLYRLIRKPYYKDAWYIAVNNWREGRVYLDD